MYKIYVQRKVEVWMQDAYTVPDLSDETLDKVIDYEIDSDDSEVLYETQEDIGPVNIYNSDWKLIRKDE